MPFVKNITSPRNLNEISVPAGDTGRSSSLVLAPPPDDQPEDPAEDANETARHACRPPLASPELLPYAATLSQTVSRLVTTQQLCATRGLLRRVTRRLSGVGPPRFHQRRGSLGRPWRELLLSSGQCQGWLPNGRRHQRLEQQRFAHLASDYEEEVMVYMLEVEGRHLPHPSFPATPPSVTTVTRTTLIRWLIHLQRQLEVSRETVYHSLALVERVLAVQHVPVHEVQLLTITALLIVSKLEETKPLQTSELLRFALNPHTHSELLALERRVLTALHFRLTSADPAFFLNYFLHLTCNSHDQLVVECCWLLVETGLVETSLRHTRPSLLAAAALNGSLRVMHGSLAAAVLPALIPNSFRLEERTVLATSLTLLEALSVARRTTHSSTEGDGSPSWGSVLSQHPRLAPDNLLLLIQQLRTGLTHLSRETTSCHTLSSQTQTQLSQHIDVVGTAPSADARGSHLQPGMSVEIANYRTENPFHQGNTGNNLWQDKELD